MLQLLTSLCFALSLLGAQYLFAGDSEFTKKMLAVLAENPLSAEGRNTLFQVAEDNPQGFGKILNELWKRPEVQSHAHLKGRVAWCMAKFIKLESDFKQNALKESQQDLRKLGPSGLLDEIDLLSLEDKINRNELDIAKISDEYLTLARRLPSLEAKADAIVSLAYYQFDRGAAPNEVPRLLAEVRNLLDQRPKPIPPAHIEALSTLTILLNKMGQTNETKVFEAQMDEICERYSLRKFCAVRAYGKGHRLLSEGGSNASALALPHYKRSLDLSLELEDNYLAAFGHYGMGMALSRSDQPELAIPHAESAANTFETLELRDWTAMGMNLVSTAYLKAGHAQQALDAAQKALRLCPKDNRSDQIIIYKQLAASYEALERYKDGMAALRQFSKLQTAELNEAADKKYLSLRNESLLKQNDNQSEQIQLLKNFRVLAGIASLLFAVALVAFFALKKQARLIRISREKMKNILDTIDEGICILNRDLQIMEGYSPHMDELFERPRGTLALQPIIDVLYGSSKNEDTAMVTMETLQACMGETSLTWELNQSSLSYEVKVGERILSLNWQPLYSSHAVISGFLLGIRDNSELRILEKKMSDDALRASMMQKKIQEILSSDLGQVRRLIDNMQRLAPGMKDRQDCLRELHTFKGSARTLGLKILATEIHGMETLLIQSENPNPSEGIAALARCILDYQELLASIMEAPSARHESRDLYDFSRIYASDMRNRMTAANCEFVGVTVLDQVLDWNPESLQSIHQMLVHALNNALDHGFIRPRLKNRSVAPALVEIKAELLPHHIEIRVKDNGNGIDWAFVQQKIKDSSKVFQRKTDVLFEDGMSSAENISETSGRGVGLSAIRSMCLALDGDVFLEESPHGGTLLTFQLPRSSGIAAIAGR